MYNKYTIDFCIENQLESLKRKEKNLLKKTLKGENFIKILDEYKIEPIFFTMTGSHLYGTMKKDSDYDIRGCYTLPTKKILSLGRVDDVVKYKEGLIDFVIFEIEKFFGLLYKGNGNVIEQSLSPLIVYSTPIYSKIRTLAKKCICKNTINHYLGLSSQMKWKVLAEKDGSKKWKKNILYAYRPLAAALYYLRYKELKFNAERLFHHAVIDIDEKYSLTIPQLEKDLDYWIEIVKAERDSTNQDIPKDNKHNYEKINELLLEIRGMYSL